MSPYKFLYCHGFASSPHSSKAVTLKQYFTDNNAELQVPDLNIPSFNQLSVPAILDQLSTHIKADNHRYRLIGSSLGGYITAALASQLGDKIESVILLCPALDTLSRWSTRLSQSDVDNWKATGQRAYHNYATNDQQQLHYAFFEQLHTLDAWPMINCPVTIVHGTADEVVPISVSREYVKRLKAAKGEHNDVQLIEVNDDHALGEAETVERIKQLVRDQWLHCTDNRSC